MNWWKSLKGKIRFDEPLKNHTTFKIGGPAKIFIEPHDLKDLSIAVALAKKQRIPVFLLGAGSNILASDSGVNGVVLKLSQPYFNKIIIKNNLIEAGSGVPLSKLIKCATSRALSGVEFLAGIPGSLGGALAMNAGAWGKEIGNIVARARVVDYRGKIKTLTAKEINFTYRRSSLDKFIILSCTVKLVKKDKKVIKENLQKYLKARLGSQERSFPNAGCVFKNPSLAHPAGRLIDLCSLKEKRIGQACISGKHANFILNLGGANSADVLSLMKLAKGRVKRKFNINLQPEIKIWP